MIELEAQLARSTAEWKLVVGHHPFYTNHRQAGAAAGWLREHCASARLRLLLLVRLLPALAHKRRCRVVGPHHLGATGSSQPTPSLEPEPFVAGAAAAGVRAACLGWAIWLQGAAAV